MAGERAAWWYADPLDGSRGRYWDGSRWTDYVVAIPDGLELAPLPPTTAPRTSRAAIASLLCSLLGLGALGVPFAHAGLQRIKGSAGAVKGRRLARIGMTLGYLEVAAMLIVVGAILDIGPSSGTGGCRYITTTGQCAPAPAAAVPQSAVVRVEHASESAQPEEAVTISMTKDAFAPASVTVSRGGTVTWRNDDAVAHAVVDAANGMDGNTDIPPGGIFRHTYTRSGTFVFGDPLHPQLTGTVYVS